MIAAEAGMRRVLQERRIHRAVHVFVRLPRPAREGRRGPGEDVARGELPPRRISSACVRASCPVCSRRSATTRGFPEEGVFEVGRVYLPRPGELPEERPVALCRGLRQGRRRPPVPRGQRPSSRRTAPRTVPGRCCGAAARPASGGIRGGARRSSRGDLGMGDGRRGAPVGPREFRHRRPRRRAPPRHGKRCSGRAALGGPTSPSRSSRRSCATSR